MLGEKFGDALLWVVAACFTSTRLRAHRGVKEVDPRWSFQRSARSEGRAIEVLKPRVGPVVRWELRPYSACSAPSYRPVYASLQEINCRPFRRSRQRVAGHYRQLRFHAGRSDRSCTHERDLVNRDDGPHTVVSTDKKFVSPVLDTDERFSHSFADLGTYEYYCSIHPKMIAKVTVQKQEECET